MSAEAPTPYELGANTPIPTVAPQNREDLSRDLTNRSLPAWRRAGLGALAVVGGLTAAGTSPALAGGTYRYSGEITES
ncbi:MAG: hypothetical protein AAB922_07595, partial [Patescibacteria group bacterium]